MGFRVKLSWLQVHILTKNKEMTFSTLEVQPSFPSKYINRYNNSLYNNNILTTVGSLTCTVDINPSVNPLPANVESIVSSE